MSDSFPFLKKVMPLIEKTALATKESMERVSKNYYTIWGAYLTARNNLILAAADLEEKDKVKIDKYHPWMNREEFERHLLSRGVWIPTDDDTEE